MNLRRTSFAVVALALGSGAAIATFVLASGAAFAAGKPVEGRIVSFECGDNCYLTLTTDTGAKVEALCGVGPCEKWLETAEMPAAFVGRRVTGTLGQGMRFDGDGNKMGKFPSFETLKLK